MRVVQYMGCGWLFKDLYDYEPVWLSLIISQILGHPRNPLQNRLSNRLLNHLPALELWNFCMPR